MRVAKSIQVRQVLELAHHCGHTSWQRCLQATESELPRIQARRARQGALQLEDIVSRRQSHRTQKRVQHDLHTRPGQARQLTVCQLMGPTLDARQW